jgi:hypothetical protein
MDIMENYNLDNKELDDGRVLFMKIHNAFSSGNFRPLGRSDDPLKPLVPTEVYRLIAGGNRRIRKTLKRSKNIRRKKHQKTYRKQK